MGVILLREGREEGCGEGGGVGEGGGGWGRKQTMRQVEGCLSHENNLIACIFSEGDDLQGADITCTSSTSLTPSIPVLSEQL